MKQTAMDTRQVFRGHGYEPKDQPKVVIIVLNWNGWRDTIECLESLQRLTYPNYQVIVVDNGSTDDSVGRIRRAYPNVVLIETDENLGYAGGNNVGINYALKHGTEYVLILNNEVKIEPNVLTVMIEVAKQSGVSVIGGLVKDISSEKKPFCRWLLSFNVLFGRR